MKNLPEHVVLQDIQENIDKLLPTLKAKKQELHLTNQDIADHTGISVDTVRKFFAGESKSPNVYNIMSMCIYFGISLDELLGNNNTQKQTTNIKDKEKEIKINNLEMQNHNLQQELCNKNILLETKNNVIKQLDIGLFTSFILWVVSVLVYIGMDIGNKEVGFIRENRISPFLLVIVVAFLIGLYFLISMVKRMIKRKSNDGNIFP